jgi:hypothetical protein
VGLGIRFSYALLLLSAVAAAQDAIGYFAELEGFVHGRSTALFRKTDDNIETTLSPKTHGEIIEQKKFYSGNFGLKLKISDGPEQGKEYWVYYKCHDENHCQDSNYKLFKQKPSDRKNPDPSLEVHTLDGAKAAETNGPTRAVQEPTGPRYSTPYVPPAPTSSTPISTCEACRLRTLEQANRLMAIATPPGVRPEQFHKILSFIQQHPDLVKNTNHLAIADMSKPWGVKRLFVYDTVNNTVNSYHTTHGLGSGSGPWLEQPTDQNRIQNGGTTTSLGCYTTGENFGYGSSFGKNLPIIGRESTNRDAGTVRPNITIHCWDQVNDVSAATEYVTSHGCLALDPSGNQCENVMNQLVGGAAVCILR